MPTGTLQIPGVASQNYQVEEANSAATFRAAIDAINASDAAGGVILVTATFSVTGSDSKSISKPLIIMQGETADTDTSAVEFRMDNGFTLSNSVLFNEITFYRIALRSSGTSNNCLQTGNSVSAGRTTIFRFIGCRIRTTGSNYRVLVSCTFTGVAMCLFDDCTIDWGSSVVATTAMLRATTNPAINRVSSIIAVFKNTYFAGGTVADTTENDCQAQISVYNSILEDVSGVGLWRNDATPAGGNPFFEVKSDLKSKVDESTAGLNPSQISFSVIGDGATIQNDTASPVSVVHGKSYTNLGSAVPIIYNLPATADDGFEVTFKVMAAQTMTIQAGAGDQIHIGTTSSSVAGTAFSSSQYSVLTLKALDDGSGNIEWIATESLGTWATT